MGIGCEGEWEGRNNSFKEHWTTFTGLSYCSRPSECNGTCATSVLFNLTTYLTLPSGGLKGNLLILYFNEGLCPLLCFVFAWDIALDLVAPARNPDHLWCLSRSLTPAPILNSPIHSSPKYIPNSSPSPISIAIAFPFCLLPHQFFQNTNLILSLLYLKSLTLPLYLDNENKTKQNPNPLFGSELSGSCLQLPPRSMPSFPLHTPLKSCWSLFRSLECPALSGLRPFAHALPSFWSVPSPFGLSRGLT